MPIFVPGMENTYPLGMDWRTAAAAGLITDCVRVAPLGTNTDIDTLTDPEDVWSGSALGVLNGIDHKLVQIPSAPVTVEVVSDNANDTAAGTGLRTMLVVYLDSTYTSKSTTITLNGTTPVAFPEDIVAINTVVRSTTGTFGGSNTGNISIRAAGGLGATYSYMVAGHGFARSSLYTVPNGFTLFIYSELFTILQLDKIQRFAQFSVPIMNSTGAIARALQIGTTSTTAPYRHEADGLPVNTVAQKNSTWITCDTVSDDNTSVTAGFVGFIIKNTRLIVSA
jgi:hypothetical protein